jgi:hypothetical protein
MEICKIINIKVTLPLNLANHKLFTREYGYGQKFNEVSTVSAYLQSVSFYEIILELILVLRSLFEVSVFQINFI